MDRYKEDGEVIRAVAGFDATFSAPKDVSAWWGLTDDPGLLEAHDIAVAAVLAHIERYGATTRVRTKNGRKFPDTIGLNMATFRQTTSREDDPQLHTHVVISTKVQTADGSWLALDARYLKQKQAALGHLYQAVLRAELSYRYDVRWGLVVNGQAPILGMPRNLLEAFSKRAAQVEAALEDKVADFRDREGRDPTQWENAALTREAAADTRATKTGESPVDLREQWIEEAAELGWTPERLVAQVRAAARNVPDVGQAVTVGHVIEQLSNRSTWNRPDVLAAVADLAPTPSRMSGQRWATALEIAADRVVESCTSLDPPDPGATRASDGRSVWVPPIEPFLTSEAVLAQEERILTFAIDAQHQAGGSSGTVVRDGLDVLQADAAASVAGRDTLVLVVGPAGTGKTTMLRAAANDLHHQHRDVFAVAPTAKAAKVLRDETGIPADTLAKLLYEWRPGATRPPREDYRLPAGSTVIVDEAGMVGTGALDRLTQLAVSQRWRLVLVGDPRQLQAVGRGGMFDELCRAAPTHELAVIHRFRHRWEQRASLQLRAGSPKALDAYLDHDRVTSGTFGDLAQRAATRWIDHTSNGKTVALVAETNEHVDALNATVQAERRRLDELGRRSVRIAGSETASVGDVVVTRRNDRQLRTDRREPVRNRERWTVTALSADGDLTLSHLQGHGLVRVPADYAQRHIRLGYAATAHGHQGDTVDVSIAVITRATSHRSLYVAATRGRDDNQLLVVTDDPTPGAARDVLEQALSNDRVDAPATAQRRMLARLAPIARDVVERVDDVADASRAYEQARRHFQETKERVDPLLQPVRDAERDLEEATRAVRLAEANLGETPRWRAGRARRELDTAGVTRSDAADRLDDARTAAAPHQADLDAAEEAVRRAEIAASRARLTRNLEHHAVGREAPGHEIDHGIDIGL